MARRPALSIRTKVVLVSALLLAIPYVGYQYVREMENYLRDGLERSVLGAAQALAGALHDRADLLARVAPDEPGGIYAYPLPAELQIDGYLSDWGGHLGRLQALGTGGDPAAADAVFGARLVAGKHAQYLYLLVTVRDADVTYRGPQSSARPAADHVRLVTDGPSGAERALVFSPISAGWITVQAVAPAAGASGGRVQAELRVRAEWRETDDGYLVEARVPLGLLGRRLGIEVVDADGGAPPRVVSTSGAGRLSGLMPLVLPAQSIEALIRGLEHTPGRRIWVVDTIRRVLARGGSLERAEPFAPINPLLGLILRPPSAEAFEEQPIVSHLAGSEVDAALAGRGTTRWQTTDVADTFVVSAAYPVWNAQRIAGAVVVEETTLGIQTVRREALARLLNQTLVVCLVGALVLALFATRLSIRLRRLRDDTERAIDAHGRVVGGVGGSRAGDEIGDLARTFSGLMERLRQYNHYLEQLARRLSHELRTPLAVVRSSLEGLQMDPGEREVFLERASDGVRRLDTIITRMSEATRLEQALQEAEVERFDLRDVAGAAVASYRATWPAQPFEWRATAEPCPVEGVPDLIVQLMDKLVANAVDFSAADAAVAVRVEHDGERLTLAVENLGPTLPAEMADQLFESMVSLRNGSGAGGDPHLGLGLYIVRLIAEFHGARASAENLPGDVGVRMRVMFPRA